MLVNQQNLQQLQVGYSAAFNKALREAKKEYDKIATTVPSSSKYNSYNWMGQMPVMREWIGEREIQNLNNYGYVIENRSFESTISVSRDDIEDDNYGVYTPLMAMLGEEASDHPNKLVFAAMRQGFKELCFDGKPFFATDHKSGEKVFSNRGTAALSPASYMAARAAMMSYIGENGEPLNIVPNLLVISPKNENQARLILKADTIDGTSNTLKDTAELMVSTQLAGEAEDYWFLLATNKFIKPFIFQERKPVKLTTMNRDTDPNVFMRKEFIYGVEARHSVGYSFWQMAYGSDGSVPAQG